MLVHRVTVILIELQQAPGVSHRRDHDLEDSGPKHTPQNKSQVPVAVQNLAEKFRALCRDVALQSRRGLADPFRKFGRWGNLIKRGRSVELQNSFETRENLVAVTAHDVDAVVGDEINPV